MLVCIERINTIDRLIKIRGTGAPYKLAEKLNISERTLYYYISFLKDNGAPIRYCHIRQSYYYQEEGYLNATLEWCKYEIADNP